MVVAVTMIISILKNENRQTKKILSPNTIMAIGRDSCNIMTMIAAITIAITTATATAMPK